MEHWKVGSPADPTGTPDVNNILTELQHRDMSAGTLEQSRLSVKHVAALLLVPTPYFDMNVCIPKPGFLLPGLCLLQMTHLALL